jgi:hypothetical protein
VTGTCEPFVSLAPGRLPSLTTRPFFTLGENVRVNEREGRFAML